MPETNDRWLYRTVGARIRKTRTDTGLTQQRLAELIGSTRTAITMLENGERAITIRHLYDIGTAIQMEPREFIPSMDELRQAQAVLGPTTDAPKASQAMAEWSARLLRRG